MEFSKVIAVKSENHGKNAVGSLKQQQKSRFHL